MSNPTERHEMASVLGHGTTNRPLLGFAKRHRTEDTKIQQQLNIALGYHVRAGNERGINLCLWAGACAHAPAPNPELGLSEDADPACSIHERVFRVLCAPSPCPSPPPGGEGIETAPSRSERERVGARVAHVFTDNPG